MARNINVRNAVKLALAVNAGLLGLSAAPGALAQEGAELEEITVTGTRIKKKDWTSNAPVATIGFEQIELTGTVNAESLLNTLPQMVPGLDRTSNNPGNGTSTVNLRGLGTARTLVLINGRRVVPTTSDGTVDINTIPTALIQNIEVLTGGASAVYGSDAVAGVVNFILKDDFEGVSMNAGYEVTEQGDAGITSIDITIGANVADGRGNVAFNMSFTDRDDLFQGDRDFSFFAQFDDCSSVQPTGVDCPPADRILIPGGSSFVPDTSIFSTLLPFASEAAIFTQSGDIQAFQTSGFPNDYYNYNPVNYIQLPQQRWQATALGHFDMNDRVTVYGQAMFTNSQVPQELAPTPIFAPSTFTLDGNPFLTANAQGILSGDNISDVSFGDRDSHVRSALDRNGEDALDPYLNPLAPGDDDYDPTWDPADSNTCTNCLFDSDFVDVRNNATGLGSAANPLPDGIDDDPRLNISAIIDADGNNIADFATASLRRRMLETGPRHSDQTFNSFSLLAGIRGDIGDSWDYDAYYQSGNVTLVTTTLGDLSTSRFDQALLLDLVADPNGGVCTDPSANGGTSGCVPMNIFGMGNVSQETVDFLVTAISAGADFKQDIFSLTFTGDLGSLELPGGPIGVAVGFEHIDNDFTFRPSQDLAAGTLAGFNGIPAVDGGYTVSSYYAEAYLPILAGAPMADLLDLELAFRSTDYTQAGDVESYKISGSWAPIDQFRIRGGFNRAVRAPNIQELFSPAGEGFPGAQDPCSENGVNPLDPAVAAICASTGVPASAQGSSTINTISGQVRAIVGGNIALGVEEADTYTFGVVVTPAALEGLTFSVDYFDIEITSAITTFGGGASNVLNTCYDPTDPNGGIGSAFCNTVNRRASGLIDFVDTSFANAATQTLTGVDLLGSYDMDLFGGDFRVNYVGTFTDEQDFTPFAGGTVLECAGKFGPNCGEPLPEYKHRMSFRWTGDKITGQLLWRLIGEVDDDDPNSIFTVETIDSQHYFDASGSYRFTDNYMVTFGIDNLLDDDPPIVGNGNNEQANTWPASYDVYGRTYFLRASATF
jgi:outer membrane receptor protein involved in Fe transport